MTLLALSMLIAFVIAAGALAMTVRNLRLYQPPQPADSGAQDLVSVCIPARNEETNIEACVRSVLRSAQPIEVLVYDDESTDSTPSILASLVEQDSRVRRVATVPMPEGWSGKQHACDRMGRAARGKWVLFTDADVRFEPGAITAAVSFARAGDRSLVSTFPRQICGTFGELLQVPMMFFILFSYLPFGRMRSTTQPSASAACGQFILADHEAYLNIGGHAAFKDSMHDGVRMPRAFRKMGYRTDLFDGTILVSVRMYHGFAQSWRGFAKNAYEGLGSVPLLLFLTAMHAIGHMAAWILTPIAFAGGDPLAGAFGILAMASNVTQRAALCNRFGHPLWLSLLHPVAVAIMTAVQWDSLRIHLRRGRVWRGRTLGEAGSERVVLVDEHDREVGTAEKIEAHRSGGRLHRAFSVFLFDGDGRLLLQRRAAGKYHFGGLWTNTCCSHPRPGELPVDAGRRRLGEEMGIDAILYSAGTFMYEAHDPASGLTERELDHVLVGRFDGSPDPNPDEVCDWRWISLEELESELRATPDAFTPWFQPAWEQARPMLDAAGFFSPASVR